MINIFNKDPRDAVNDFIRDTHDARTGGKSKWVYSHFQVGNTILQSLKRSCNIYQITRLKKQEWAERKYTNF